MLTRQEIFDRVASHLLIQKEHSVDVSGDMCLYRGMNGIKCAVGVLIPDEVYSPSFEGKDFMVVWVTVPALADIIAAEDLYLTKRLQQIHDACSVLSWRKKLLELAVSFELDVSVFDNHPPVGADRSPSPVENL